MLAYLLPVLTLAAALHHGPVPPDVARAVAVGCELEAERYPVDPRACAALVLVYAWHESRWQAHPDPVSSDAVADISCGLLQLPCRWLRIDDYHWHTTAWEARAWLALLRRGTLAGLSGGGRAGERLARVREGEAQAALLASDP